MFSYAMNVVVGPKIGRKLLTGSYVVADVMCSKCGEKLGWKYVETYAFFQKKKSMRRPSTLTLQENSGILTDIPRKMKAAIL